MASSPTPSLDPQHKDYPYAHWLSQEQWKQALHRRAVHKALDIAEEPDDVNVNHQRWNGLGWKELAVITAGLLGGGYLVTHSAPDNPPPAPAASSPADSEYEVRFFDAQGNLIEVPHISQRDAP